jgi:excisionase family DNA binding protein
VTPPVPLLTIPETATALAVSPRTVYALIGDGKLASVRFGRSRRIRQTALERFITDHERFEGTRGRRRVAATAERVPAPID